MKAFKLITLSFVWLLAWFASFGFITYFIGDSLGWYSQIKNTTLQCLAANSIKAFLFFIYVYYQLLIVRNVLIPNESLFARLNFIASYKNGLAALKKSPKNKANRLLAINLIWIVYFGFVSLLLLLTIDRLMGDCDISDIVCACDNTSYMHPFISLMLLVSVAYLNSIYIAKTDN